MAYLNPSLNDLELGGLMCQLVTLFCGLGCLMYLLRATNMSCMDPSIRAEGI